MAAVFKESPQQLSQMPNGQDNVRDASSLQLQQNDLQNGDIANGHQGLGKYFCIGGKACTLPASKDDCLHVAFSPSLNPSYIRIHSDNLS
jgi:hypothetical protein